MLKLPVNTRMKAIADDKCNGLGPIPLLEIAGQSRVLIENHLGVLAYSLNEIQIKVKFGKFVVEGQKLELMQMDRAQLVIRGQIDSVQVVRG